MPRAAALRRAAAAALLFSVLASSAIDLYLNRLLSDDSVAAALSLVAPGAEEAAHMAGRMLRMKAWPLHYAASLAALFLFVLLFRAGPRDPLARLLALLVAAMGVTGAVVTFAPAPGMSEIHHLLAWPVAGGLALYAAREAAG